MIAFLDFLKLKNVKAENYVFENLSFEIDKCEKIALVGVYGAGKTTIVKLMTGLFVNLLNQLNLEMFLSRIQILQSLCLMILALRLKKAKESQLSA